MSTLLLDGNWQLSSSQHPAIAVACPIPGDVHSALITAEQLPPPYFDCNENEVQWVGESEWTLSRSFGVEKDFLNGQAVDLKLAFVDTMATIAINGNVVLHCSNMFRQYQANVLPYLQAGENTIEITLHRNDLEAAKRAERLPFPVPWAVGNNQIPHMNTLRKTQCHAGWDWGICLLVSGVYQSISLTKVEQLRLSQVRTEQHWQSNGRCQLDVIVDYEQLTTTHSPATLAITFDGNTYNLPLPISDIGSRQYRHSIAIAQPRRWWPAGYGEQALYSLDVQLYGVIGHSQTISHSQAVSKQIGLRELELDTQTDAIGSAMTFKVNGKAIMAKGANWIPLDALPSAHTPERYRQLLEDAVAANMNMLRVWGGGMYEQDIFYELCDELGLLVWQDLMFACALYPSTPEFLADVEAEVCDQVQRLSDHPSIALWCGDNEVIGAIGWYPESRANRERYVVNYDRLNRTLAQVVEREDPSRRFWASSPCNGELDFGDAWHDDNKGDMHFWDVWHSGKSFDAYHSVKPRFCSEFGYQSWPSLPTVKTFAKPDEWNVTSPTFEQHQKNGRGNSIITEMFTRYFRFPSSFDNMLYLSQVQQALAIKTASEYWRAHKAHCRGILYWQLNDCWPVSSWSSIEYNGRWKQLHYHAKRFFAPQLATFIEHDGQLSLHLINDQHREKRIEGRILKVGWDGTVIQQWPINNTLAADQAMEAWQTRLNDTVEGSRNHFYHVELQCNDVIIENDYFPVLFKQMNLPNTTIHTEIGSDEQGVYIELDCGHPALFVHLEIEGAGRFDDSSFTLLPSDITGKVKRVRYIGNENKEAIASTLRVYHLRDSY